MPELGAVAAETDARERAARLVAERSALLTPLVEARVREVREWPAGHRCPLGRLREAWVAQRYGSAKAIEAGGAMAGRVSPDVAARIGSAVSLYEAFAELRPPGWPAGGAAALCVLAAEHRADVLAGDVARLLVLAKGMRAATQLDDRRRVDRVQTRAVARRGLMRRFWISPRPPRIETSERRRQRVRDDVLLLGHDPAAWPNAALALASLPITPSAGDVRLVDEDRRDELDGIGARAARYRNELRRGRWRLP